MSHQGCGGDQKGTAPGQHSTRGPGRRLLPAASFPRQAYENQMELVNICFQNQFMTDIIRNS